MKNNWHREEGDLSNAMSISALSKHLVPCASMNGPQGWLRYPCFRGPLGKWIGLISWEGPHTARLTDFIRLNGTCFGFASRFSLTETHWNIISMHYMSIKCFSLFTASHCLRGDFFGQMWLFLVCWVFLSWTKVTDMLPCEPEIYYFFWYFLLSVHITHGFQTGRSHSVFFSFFFLLYRSGICGPQAFIQCYVSVCDYIFPRHLTYYFYFPLLFFSLR